VKKRTAKPKKTGPKKDQAWFERKVSELGARLAKLPTRPAGTVQTRTRALIAGGR